MLDSSSREHHNLPGRQGAAAAVGISPPTIDRCFDLKSSIKEGKGGYLNTRPLETEERHMGAIEESKFE
jgi:hypothetical protein